MTYQPHATEPAGLVIEDARGVRLLAVPTAVLELLEGAHVLQFTRDGLVQRFTLRSPGDALPAGVPGQPHPSPALTTAQLVHCQQCGAGDKSGEPECPWCGTRLPTRA